jgi:tetratricopeptide (TPR) repeat protein
VATYAALLSALGRPVAERPGAKRSAPPLPANALGRLLAACSLVAAVLYVATSRLGEWPMPASLYLLTLLAVTAAAWRAERGAASVDADDSVGAGFGKAGDRAPLHVRLVWVALWPLCGLLLLHAVFWPLGSSALARRGQQLTELGEPREAIRSLERAVARDPENPVFWRLLARAHSEVAVGEPDPERKRIELETARDGLRSALELEPEALFAQVSLARTLTELAVLEPPGADVREALGLFDQILAQAPGQLGFRRDAARAALALGEPDRAEAYARQNLERLPDFAPSRAQLGLVAVVRAEWEEAVRELEVAVEQRWFGDSLTEAEAWAGLARARLELGQPREALDAADRALEANPDLPEARLHKQRALELLAPEATGADRSQLLPGREVRRGKI